MRRCLAAFSMLFLSLTASAQNRIYNPQVKTLQAVVNQEWLSFPTVMRLQTDDVLNVSFDELSHDYHRYTCHLQHCEADWQPSEEIFESDWLEGLNDIIIDDYETSVNTISPYTHYRLQLPNEQCRLKLSGNYRLSILEDDELVAIVDFMVTEQTMKLSLQATTNTDIDVNKSHQQLSVNLSYGDVRVTNPEDQIQLVVMQNGRSDTRLDHITPTYRNTEGLQWSHCKELIFDAGNEYHKFEVLDPSHPTMGIDRITWDGENYQVYPFPDQPRLNYLYDEDADGAFYIRNSDNRENDTSCEYVYVNYRLLSAPIPQGKVIINGQWTTGLPNDYYMTYDASEGIYHAQILQKQGYYSYQYLLETTDGKRHILPSEGSFYQTENRYQALVYYKGIGERTWRLTAFRGIVLASSYTPDKTQQ